jgi:hypothetical protein
MKTIDLRHEAFTIDELFQMASGETLVVQSKEGATFIVEAAESFDREVEELGRSTNFGQFLQERFHEPGRVPIEDIERRLASSLPAHGENPCQGHEEKP